MTDSRYPYTHACDYVRSHVDDFNEAVGMRTPTISRSQASQAIKGIAQALGMTHEELACKLADAALRPYQGGESR
jgi:uncharacterized protein YidB (DUF937 family)